MYVRIVTFRPDLPEPDYAALAERSAPAFLGWRGLRAKLWLADPGTHTYGGVYVFGSKQDADVSRGTELFGSLQTAFADVTIREFGTLPGPTAVTAARLEGSRP